MTIEAVLFDYGMVLSGPPDMVARRRMEELLAADAESFHAAYWKFREGYDRGETASKYWQKVADELQRPLNEATLTALIEADVSHWTQPNEAMIAWAGRLQRAGVRTGILSNLGDAMEVGIHARLPWLAEFTHKTFSHRLGIAKPDAAIYRVAIEGLGVKAEQILFIDDREENVAAARAMGMKTVVYENQAAFELAMCQAGYEELLAI